MPTVMFAFLPFPAVQAGGYRLANGESVTILYDMDDINFSEIVVEDTQGRQFQLVVDPNPTTNQYHAPRQRQFVINSFKGLRNPDPQVSAAARRAQGRQSPAILLNVLMFVPWLAYGGIRLALLRQERGARARPAESR